VKASLDGFTHIGSKMSVWNDFDTWHYVTLRQGFNWLRHINWCYEKYRDDMTFDSFVDQETNKTNLRIGFKNPNDMTWYILHMDDIEHG
jgi:hypothetical protein